MSYRKFFVTALLVLATVGLVTADDWQTDYAKGLATAKEQNKQVLLDFTGSDWCGPCIELRKRVFSQPEFRKYAEKNLVFVEVDYPQRKKQSAELKSQNEKLAKQYGIDEKGYPAIVLLDPNCKIVREFNGYSGEGVADIIAWIEGRKKL
jgi:thioredoxin-related protein